jgi:hypothetical protein
MLILSFFAVKVFSGPVLPGAMTGGGLPSAVLTSAGLTNQIFKGKARARRCRRQGIIDPARLLFLDESAAKTNMTASDAKNSRLGVSDLRGAGQNFSRTSAVMSKPLEVGGFLQHERPNSVFGQRDCARAGSAPAGGTATARGPVFSAQPDSGPRLKRP